MKKAILITILLLLCASFVQAADFTVRFYSVKDRISPGETAVFQINITNNLDISTDFLVYPGDVEWDLTTDPSEDRQKKVGPKKSEIITLHVKPTQDFWPNLYGVSTRVRNIQTGEVISKDLLVQILGDPAELQGNYLPAVKSTLHVKSQIDPRDGIPVNIRLENQNRLQIDKLIVKLKSDLINKEYETTLNELQSKDLEFLIKIDPLTNPRTETLSAEIIVPTGDRDFNFRAETKEYSIVQYGEIKTTEDTKKLFLKSVSNIKLENTGNIQRSYSYTIEKKWYSPLFLSAYPKAKVQKDENGISMYTWEGELAKSESSEITVTKSYRWVAILVLILVALILLYFQLRSPFVIAKAAKVVGTSEGGVSDLNIQLHIKNRSNKVLHDIEIKDKVQNLLSVIPEVKIGTLQATKILKHDRRGTILTYDLDSFEPFEERIISYRVKAKMSILGDFSLPKAVIKFKKEKIGKRFYAHSNVFRMSFERK